MKKIISILAILVLTAALAACGNKDKESSGNSKTITVGASPAPHAEILEKAKPILKKRRL